MRILVVGTGGVGGAFAAVASRRDFYVLQTAINPVVAFELLARGVWQGRGVLGPEAFPAAPFLDLLAEYDEPHGVVEGDPRV